MYICKGLTLINSDEYKRNNNNNNECINNSLLIDYGYFETKGVRRNMEDRMICECNFDIEKSLCTSNKLSLFAIFDGHSGDECSKFCQKYFPIILKNMLQKYSNIYVVFNETVALLDDKFSKYEGTLNESNQGSGSTLCVILIDNETHDAWVINVGDSRAVKISNNNNNDNNNNIFNNEQMSIEHKPILNDELIRIKKNGGFVSRGYLMNILGVSRAIGDVDFKLYWKNILISKPDITHFKLNNNDKYILLGCDGLFDVFTNNDITKFISNGINSHSSLNNLCQNICNHAINVRKSKDNVSTILIKFNMINSDIIPNAPITLGRFTVIQLDETSDDDTDTTIEDSNNNILDSTPIYMDSFNSNSSIDSPFKPSN